LHVIHNEELISVTDIAL